MNNLERAKALFQSGGYTCVLCKDDDVRVSALTGISPMLEFIDSGADLKGFSAADKIAGKAAAMLFALAGVKEVYACIMSEQAVEVFLKYGVLYSCDTLVPTIVNRAGTGLCPMEQAVKDIEEPSDALDAIKRALEFLRKGNAQPTPAGRA